MRAAAPAAHDARLSRATSVRATQVLTDVIHICDSKLTYYPGTFRDFQRLRPEIAAGLPSPANAVQKAKAQLAAPAAAAPSADGQGNGAAAADEVRASHTRFACFPRPARALAPDATRSRRSLRARQT